MRVTPIDAVVIGRNEGARLLRCLDALMPQVRQVIYVDSGSTDGSADAARARGARVVDLDMSVPFTAARARNAGLDLLSRQDTQYVQLVDGDCTVTPGWIGLAADWLDRHPDAAVACGRRRETHPEASVYNRLCDREWDTPTGPALACGGDALMRLAAVQDVGGFRADLIAGEEPELCVRLRQAGWTIWRLDAEMTAHDASILRFGQWWKRTRRAGHAFAEGAALHGAAPECHWVRETRRALIWGAVLPVCLLGFVWVWPPAAVLWLVYPAQVVRLAARSGLGKQASWETALFNVLGKVPEALGALQYITGRLRGKRAKLLEYK